MSTRLPRSLHSLINQALNLLSTDKRNHQAAVCFDSPCHTAETYKIIMHTLSIALLLAILAVGMAQPGTLTRGVYSPAPTRTSFQDFGSSSSSCLFTEQDVNAQDLATIKKSCGKACCMVPPSVTASVASEAR